MTALLESARRHCTLRGVIHVGAHAGEEVACYDAAGLRPIVLIEANPRCCDTLGSTFGSRGDVTVVHAAMTDFDGRTTLHLHTSRSGSQEAASLLDLKRFKDIVQTMTTPSAVEVPARRLDEVRAERFPSEAFNLLVIDTQGTELEVLRGAERTLASIDAVIVEVALLELYDGGAAADAIRAFLDQRGFVEVDALFHELRERDHVFPAWGELLFVRRTMVRDH